MYCLRDAFQNRALKHIKSDLGKIHYYYNVYDNIHYWRACTALKK